MVFEALIGGDFAEEIDPEWVTGEIDDGNCPDKLQAMAKNMAKWEKKLKARRPILVGHNQFFDLCFIYEAFLGPLKDSFNVFQKQVYTFLRHMVDTKYLYQMSHVRHEMLADDNLQEVFKSMKGQNTPLITAKPGYGYGKSFTHQAGYDSRSLWPGLSKTLTLMRSRLDDGCCVPQVIMEPTLRAG